MDYGSIKTQESIIYFITPDNFVLPPPHVHDWWRHLWHFPKPISNGKPHSCQKIFIYNPLLEYKPVSSLCCSNYDGQLLKECNSTLRSHPESGECQEEGGCLVFDSITTISPSLRPHRPYLYCSQTRLIMYTCKYICSNASEVFSMWRSARGGTSSHDQRR